MPPWQPPVLEGRLVRLEPLRADHLDGLWVASRAPRTWRWLSIDQPASRAEMATWISDALDAEASGRELPLTTIASGRVVGSTRFLALRPEHQSVEIGWTWLHPDVWGTGINVEAKLLMLAHAFEAWGCRRVELKTDALNERSRAAIEALGATFEGIRRKHMLVRGGENRDTAWYAILDEDWAAVRETLRHRLERRFPLRGKRQD